MTEPGGAPPRPVHRFVPTLTEVVLPPPAMDVPEPSPITPEVLEGIVDAALKRVEAGLTQKLPELLAVLLHEQALALSERLRREVRSTVRESVEATVAEVIPELRRRPASGTQMRNEASRVQGLS